MAFDAGKQSVIYADGVNLSAYFNKVSVEISGEAPDTTCFGDTYHTAIGGLKEGTISASGLFEKTVADPALEATLADTDSEWAVGPAGDTAGYPVYCSKGVHTEYTLESPVDGVVSVSISVQCSAGPERCWSLKSAAAATTESGNGTAHNNAESSAAGGAAWVQCVAADTPTSLDINVVHADDAGFTVNKATLASFTQITAAGAEERISLGTGTIRQYVRVEYVIVGTSFTFFVGYHRS